jgi:hypothetical protein
VGEAPVTPVYALDSSYLTFPTNRAITGPRYVVDEEAISHMFNLVESLGLLVTIVFGG